MRVRALLTNLRIELCPQIIICKCISIAFSIIIGWSMHLQTYLQTYLQLIYKRIYKRIYNVSTNVSTTYLQNISTTDCTNLNISKSLKLMHSTKRTQIAGLVQWCSMRDRQCLLSSRPLTIHSMNLIARRAWRKIVVDKTWRLQKTCTLTCVWQKNAAIKQEHVCHLINSHAHAKHSLYTQRCTKTKVLLPSMKQIFVFESILWTFFLNFIYSFAKSMLTTPPACQLLPRHIPRSSRATTEYVTSEQDTWPRLTSVHELPRRPACQQH